MSLNIKKQEGKAMPKERDKYGRAFKKGVDKEAAKLAEQLGAVAVVLVFAGVVKAAPHIKNGVAKVVLSGARKGRAMLRRGREE